MNLDTNSGADTRCLCVFSKTELRRLEAAERIWRETPQMRGEVGYMARCFVVAGLPHADPGNVPVWSRANGFATLTVQQGYVREGGRLIGVGFPFGSTARWLLLFVFTEAVRSQSPRVSLGLSLTAFLRALGLSRDGHRIRSVRRQLHRLLAASIRFTFRDHDVVAGRDLSLASDYMLWRQPSGVRALGFAVLHDSLFRDLISHPIPLDLGAIRALRDSPLAMDLFVWLSFRLRSLRQPLSLSWLIMQEQFGSDYSATKEFARNLRKELRRVHVVWPTLKTKFYRGGVTFFPPDELPVKMRRR